MDVVKVVNQAGEGAAGFMSLLASGPWLAIGGVFLLLAFLLRSRPGKRLTKGIEETFFSNWRLAVLGTTSVLLSLVAGYTTFDGLRNFTGGGMLSLLATFGIQGVMLVTAWLIGESFAAGMNQQASGAAARSGFSRGAQAMGGAVFGFILFVAIGTLIMQGLSPARSQPTGMMAIANKWADNFLILAVGISLCAIFALYSASDLVKPYLQSVRVMIRNIILWVMFLFCMSVSVFFSFDSHFSGIFPMAERVRASELRAQNQVAGIVADIGSTIQTKQAQEAEALFQADGWSAYERNLTGLVKAAQGAERDIEAYFVAQMEQRRTAIAQQQERIASAVSSQAGLSSKKTTLVEELSRLKGERPAMAADLTEKKSELDNRVKAIDAKRVEAMAEDKGVEGTGKTGKGPVYRERVAELGKMQDYVKIQQDRVNDAQRRLTTLDSRVAQIERELAAIDGDIAKLRGEAQTAESRIKVTEQTKAGEEGPKVDPARVRAAFEAARMDFRQEPTAERLSQLQQLCTQLYGALAATPATRDRVRAIDCDPKTATEAAARVFALNDGITTFARQCQGGDKLNQQTNADALFGFARKCLADSGLPSKETDQLRTKINFIELNRDDKAHRFVVTWNAFQDGNRLAYLALAIAITIDSLVFMSGLFGANAVRSPLSDVPSTKARSGRQLEAIIDTALIPHKFETARLVLGAMLPMTQRDGFMARVVVDEHDPHAADLRRVLNAGTTIGAVRHADHDDTVYEIRSELFEYLSAVAKKEFDANKDHVNLAEMERTVMVALLPADKVQHNSEMILSYMHPIREKHGFMAELRLDEVKTDDAANGTQHLRTVRSALNAGATFDRVQRAGEEDASHYFIHGDFYKTLVKIRARLLSSTAMRPALTGSGSGGSYGGEIREQRGAIERGHKLPEITDQRDRPPSPAPAPLPEAEAPAARTPTPQRAAVQRGPLQSADEAHIFYWSELIGVLGIDAQHAVQRLGTIGTREQAQHTWQLLMRLAQANPRLNELITDHKEAQEEALARRYSELRLHASERPDNADELDRADGEIQSDLSVFMLFPENGLLDYLIAGIERAAVPDNGLLPGEQRLLDELRAIRDTLAAADLSDPDTWTRVGLVLQKVAAEQRANIARFTPGGDKRTLN